MGLSHESSCGKQVSYVKVAKDMALSQSLRVCFLYACFRSNVLGKKRLCQGMVQAWVAHFVTPLKRRCDKYDR